MFVSVLEFKIQNIQSSHFGEVSERRSGINYSNR